MRSWLRRVVHEYATQILTAPLGSYMRTSGQDTEQLKRHVRKGDVLLVCGDQRVSEVIRYLTQSSWSHSAIYVGDELLKRFPERAAELEERYGDEAQHLIIEAIVEEGVVASPISKYRGFHMRLCRPFGLEDADVSTIMDLVIRQIGSQYDVDNLIDLARYFLPVSLVPARFRREALEFGSGQPTEVICSSMIARAFYSVGFPILPRTEEELETLSDPEPVNGNGNGNGTAAPGPRAYHTGIGTPSWPSRRPLAKHLRMSRHPPALITPRDFDLSPYFEIVKFSLIESVRQVEPPARTAVRRVASVFPLPLWRRLRGASPSPREAVNPVRHASEA